ncbi:MAG: hypothetical protein ACTSPG_09765 [Candidatus Hodarchaeales archaeon]
MSAIPPSIRKILDTGRGEVRQLEQQYHIWLFTTIISALLGLALVLVSIILLLYEDRDSLLLVRLLIGLAVGLDVFVFYVLLKETQSRRRYLLEIQRLMMSGLSFIDSIRRGFRDFLH